MYTKTSLAALFGAMTAVSAQSSATAKATGTIVDILFPSADSMPLVGSVIDVKSALTTMSVACPTGTDSSDCGFPDGGFTITRGPQTEIMSVVEPTESDSPVMVNYGWACSLGGTTTAECTYSAVASVTGSVDPSIMSEVNAQGTPQSTVISLSGESLKYAMLPVTITAGAEKLAQTGSAQASNSAQASDSAQASNSASGSKTGAAGSSSGSKTGSAASPSNTGAASNVKMGGFALGGALAAVFML